MKKFYTDIIKKHSAENIFVFFGLFFSFWIITVAANAAPPGNDNFANANLLTGNSGQGVVFNNGEATKEPNEPAHAFNRGGRSVWYKYVASGNGALTLSTAASLFNTTLAVYTGSNVGNLTRIASNNDTIEGFGWSSRSRVVIGTKSGETYYIAVDGHYSDNGSISTGNVILNFTFTNAASNDNFANAINIDSNNGGGTTVTTNVGASKESGEPNHAGNPGGKSVWFKWTALAVNGIRTIEFTAESFAVNGGNTASALFAVYTGSSVDSLTEVARAVPFYHGKIVFTPVPGTTYYIAVDGSDSGQGANAVTTTFSFRIHKNDKVPDIDGDGKADLTVYRPTTGTWYSLGSITGQMQGFQFGINGDKPLIVDKNRDGKIDYTVFRPDTGDWYVKRSDIQSVEIFKWGQSADIAMYRRRFGVTGTNDALPAIYRPSTGVWYLYTGGTSQILQWGQPGDIPVLADFSGDGTDNLTVFRPSNGTWYILLSQSTFEFRAVQFGATGDKPVPADYDRDGRADIAVYRPAEGNWYILHSSDGSFKVVKFGIAGDIPQPADYDGDHQADPAVYRNGVWWILQSSNNTARVVSFGLSNDIPLTAPAN